MSTAEETRPAPVEAAPAATTMCEAFQATAARFQDQVALSTPDGSVEVTFGEYAARVRQLAGAFAAAGIGRGDTVALLMSNRIEFHLCDTAAVHLGATPFSVYPTSSPEQIAYLLENSKARVMIAEEAFVDRIKAARGEGAEPSTIVCVDGAPDGTVPLADFEAGAADGFDFDAAWQAVTADDVLTLIYTSGTTGPPKGVETTHANMLAQCRAVGSVLPLRPGARLTSYLPSAHIADRWSSHYNQMVFGIHVIPVADARQVAAVLPVVKPTIWGAVPRVVEKIKAALDAAVANEPDDTRRGALQTAIATGVEVAQLKDAGKPVPDALAERYAALDAAVLSKLREKIGLDQVEWMVVGAAPMSRDVHEFLLAIGLPVTEIYGMTEASCCLTMVHPDGARIGSVGPAIPGLELKVADDGELLAKGPTITRGYRGDPEKTAEAIDSGGWLHTGDVVTMDDDGFVRIVDRKKELIINAGGKNMSPANIEGVIKGAHPLIGQVAVIGDRRPYNVALIVLDPDAAAAHAARAGMTDASVAAVAADPDVRAAIDAAVEGANAKLARVEQIKKYELIAEEWLPGGDELTPTMKLKRRPIDAKYSDVVEGLYA
ncbi:Long-chain-fatty-acid--CoA ligase FadD15 [Paraconexibacter sp. AEG42_29]|uniref:Acyl-CoA synthetase n=1 Tax=Paraconexibacter sp. AEG42_29 TaxID=2997339 RepID=A0AAU7B189_9ACTN